MIRFALAGALLAGCTAHSLWAPIPDPEQETVSYFEDGLGRGLDMLVMVDDSGSMENKQDNLARNFSALIDELRKSAAGLPDLHLAVISSDLGAGVSRVGSCDPVFNDRGAFSVKHAAGCPGLSDPDAHFIVSSDNETHNNYQGDVGAVFACLARLGSKGCGLEEQLASMQVALTRGQVAQNAGFLRDDAVLAVLLITDEDDCSVPSGSTMFEDVPPGIALNYLCYPPAATCGGQPLPSVPFSVPVSECRSRPDGGGKLVPISEFVTFLRSLKKSPDDLVVSAVAGVPQPGETGTYQASLTKGGLDIAFSACGGNGGGAPAMRIQELVDAFGDNGTISSICADDFGPALRRTGELVRRSLDRRCLDLPFVDGDPRAPGIQPDCVVTEKSAGASRALPRCSSSGEKPCWNLLPPGQAGNGCQKGHYFDVTRASAAPAGTTLSIRCATRP
jgi:hypothetical protein